MPEGIDRRTAIEAFLRDAGWTNATRSPLPGDASFRRYVRLRDGERRAMLMDAPPPKEGVRPFVTVAGHLTGLGYSAPRLFAADRENGLLLIEDFGDDTFTRLLAGGEAERPLYDLAVDLLIDLHRNPAAPRIELPAYDDGRLLAEAALLVDWYWPAIHGNAAAAALRRDYLQLWREVLPATRLVPQTLVLRDYHVDNLMRVPGRAGLAACGLLDFQDAVIGPTAYDLVSLLEDARRDVAPALASALTARYLDAFPDLDRDAFAAAYSILGGQRSCKIVGIFTRLCVRDGKPHYLDHLPRVWSLIEHDLRHPALAAVKDWMDQHIPPADRRRPALAKT
ncbi:MAG: aminoglycoside phosphotransferase [Rhodospirillaceae bacterium]|nr:aminoglycoside phosphotransferase [Rhodospirillaceae bacterium]